MRALFSYKFLLSSLFLTLALSTGRTEPANCQNLMEAVTFPKTPAVWRQPNPKDDFSQFLRANARHFWAWSRAHAKEYLGDYLLHEGFVVGDMHMGNLSAVELHGSLEMLVADFDSAGGASLVLDLTRHVITTQAVNPQIKTQEFVDAYTQGLSDSVRDVPEFLALLFGTSKTKVLQSRDTYVEKNIEYIENTKSYRILIESSEAKPLPAGSEQLRRDIQEIFKPRTVLDVISFVSKDGGSAGVQRYRALIQDGDHRNIIEFKHLVEPETAAYENQPNPRKRMTLALKYFWKDAQVGDPNYGIVRIGNQDFWMRPKSMSLIDIPYSSNKPKEQEFIRDLSLYQTYMLGLLHKEQPGGLSLLKDIEKNQTRFTNAISNFSKTYEDLAVQAYRSR